MARVITAPENIDIDGFKVFLAGAIDMGAAVDWQADVIESLSHFPDLVLLNPRRAAFTAETLDEQILWELDALEKADLILLWFPAESRAPVSFLEAGLYMQSGKLVLGAEDGFYRRRNLELTARHYGLPLYMRLDDLIDEVSRRQPTA